MIINTYGVTKTTIEYVWIDGNGGLRGKTRSFETTITNIEQIPDWNYDGSSTNQASGNDSEVVIKPVALFKDPFHKSSHTFIVLCDTWRPNGEPHPTNTRHIAKKTFDKYASEVPVFGLEQEYFLVCADTIPETLTIWPQYRIQDMDKQGQYYCGVGGRGGKATERKIADEHYWACAYAGISISGKNAEVAPAQWEFQIGKCTGIDEGDQLWMARYILLRVCETYNATPLFDNKPFNGEWNGSGCHANFSTKSMREENGLDHIISAINKLEQKHTEHMLVYGKGNEARLTGSCETASINTFTWGVADRTASIRIGHDTFNAKKGYLEDRRPGANCDPYLVTEIITSTVLEY